MMDAETRLRRYGAISEEKIDLLSKIERDYSEMSAEAWAKRRGNLVTSNESMMQTQQMMEKEKLADIAAVLTPEELVQYDMRNSQAASMLINRLRNMDITEAEYTRLYQAQKAFNEANPQRATPDASSYAQRQMAQLALNEETRAVLGEERFYSFLESSDFQYANTAKVFTAFPDVKPAAIYQVYRLQQEMQQTMSQSARDGRITADRAAEIRSTIEGYGAKLEALVGTAAADAYRKQGMGRIFNTVRSMSPSGTGTPGTLVVPVVNGVAAPGTLVLPAAK